MIPSIRKPRAGLLLLSPERFADIGQGTARGSYRERKEAEAAWMVRDCAGDFDVTFPGIVWNTQDVKRAMDAFVADKVDFVLALYLSWAEDYAWIRFLRDMPPVPVLFAHRMREEINLKDTHDDDEFTEYLCCGAWWAPRRPAATTPIMTVPCWKPAWAPGRRCWSAPAPSATRPGRVRC